MNDIRKLLTTIASRDTGQPSTFGEDSEHHRRRWKALQTLRERYAQVQPAIKEFFQQLTDSGLPDELKSETLRRATPLARSLLARDARELAAERNQTVKERWQHEHSEIDPFLDGAILHRFSIPEHLAPEPDLEVQLDGLGNVVRDE